MTRLYVDSSAALKRVFLEAETGDVARVLQLRFAEGELVASSTLAQIEVARALLRGGIKDVAPRVAAALAGVAEVPLNDELLYRARTIGPSSLRSLDAIHLASAIFMGAQEMLTFDLRLAAAAESVGVKAIP